MPHDSQNGELTSQVRACVHRFLDDLGSVLETSGVNVRAVHSEMERLEMIVTAVVDAQVDIVVVTWERLLDSFPAGK